MTPSAYLEKRRDNRIAISYVSVDVCCETGGSWPSEFCPVCDLSAGGMRFAARNDYAPGNRLRLTFSLPDSHIPIRACATVVHRTCENDLFGTGVQFNDLGLAEQKLLRSFIDTRFDQDQKKNEKNAEINKNLKPGNAKSDYTIVGSQECLASTNDTYSIINQCINGDRRAQKELFRKYRDMVHRLVCRLLRSDSETDDVIQLVFISFFKSLHSFKGLSSLDTWIYRITVKVCTDQLRKKYRKRKLAIVGSVDDETSRLQASDEYTPHSGLERKELVHTINLALEKLSVEKRLVVLMYEIEGKSLEEIAEILDKPLGTVKSRIFHARRDLGKLLRKYIDS